MLDDSCTNGSGDLACNCDAGYSGDGTVGNCNYIHECESHYVTLVLITAVLTSRVLIQLVHSSVHVILVIVVMVLNVQTLTNAPNSHTVVMQLPNVQINIWSYFCLCNSNYSEDGFHCSDIDECDLGTKTCVFGN